LLLTYILALAIAAYVWSAWIVALTLSTPRAAPERTLDTGLPAVAVVVAARDEEQHIAQCVDALLAQRYPAEDLEIVVVDDHSRDATAEIVRELAEREARITFVEASAVAAQPGKASALAVGIDTTSAEIILTTDADCIPPPEWVSAMVARLRADAVACLGGVTQIAGYDAFARAQGLDWLLGFSVAGALSELGYPLTAMGNNMAFRRLDYQAVGGYRRFAPSPTEDYALFKALDERPGGARLLVAPELITHTRPARTLRRFVSQRRRWARGGMSAPIRVYALYATIWLAHAAPLLTLTVSPAAALAGVLLKVAADGLILNRASSRLGLRTDWSALPLLESLLWLYVVLVPITLVVSPALSWKGRKI
jgi:cellulose synthase/poly-beta-1,6-N-acetylglucosamine synthase-like glycosyltransferase